METAGQASWKVGITQCEEWGFRCLFRSVPEVPTFLQSAGIKCLCAGGTVGKLGWKSCLAFCYDGAEFHGHSDLFQN